MVAHSTYYYCYIHENQASNQNDLINQITAQPELNHWERFHMKSLQLQINTNPVNKSKVHKSIVLFRFIFKIIIINVELLSWCCFRFGSQWHFVVVSIFVDFSFRLETRRQMNGLDRGKRVKIQKPFPNVLQSRMPIHAIKKAQI